MEVKVFTADTLQELFELIAKYDEESGKRILNVGIIQYTDSWEAKVYAI